MGMKKFSQLVTEARKNYDSVSLLQSDISSYINKVKKSIPADVQKAIYLTQKYDLTTTEAVEQVRTANKSDLKGLVDKLNIPSADLEALWSLLKGMKSNYKLMPQYMTASQREALEKGKLAMDDLAIDLQSSAGRNAAVKMYTPLVYKIVNQYVGQSRLDKASLISAGLLGLANAINDWKPVPDDKHDKVVSFKTYAGNRIKQQILNDMNAHGHDLTGTNSYATKNYGASLLDAVSLDGFAGDDEKFNQDHMGALGVEDKPDKNDERLWQKVYKLLAQKFTARDMDIFYRFFGLNGHKREKSKDIAKSYGMSEGNIRNSVLNKIIKYMKENNALKSVLADLQDIYTECLMVDLCGMEQNTIIETLLSDDTFILLEELNCWRNKYTFTKILSGALAVAADPIINKILEGDFQTIDENIKTHRTPILKFLQQMYPTVRVGNLTDMGLIECLQEVQTTYKKFQ